MRFDRLDSLLRNALSLMATVGTTSVLGLLFWIVAARNYSTTTVGNASAQIAAATLVSSIAALNIGAVITRLIPKTGVRTRWFVLRSYAITAALAVVMAAALTFTRVGRDLLGGSLMHHLAFVVMVLLLLLFVLQDAVLTGLRRSHVVFVENTSFAVAKLVLLIAFAVVLPTTGILWSWFVPIGISVAAVSIYLFFRAIPEHEHEASGESYVPSRTKLFSFVSAEYVKAMLSTGVTWLLPLIVTAKLGAEANAYFWIPWLINSSAVLLPYGMSTAYVVESSFAGRQSAAALNRAIKIGGAVALACALVEFFVVPYVLKFAGPGYAENGTTLVRILALTLPFNALNALYGTFAWMEQRLWRLVVLQAANAVVLLGGTLLFIDDHGINAVGFAYMASQIVLGVGSIPPIVRRLRMVNAGTLPDLTFLNTTDEEEPAIEGDPRVS